VEKDLLYGFSVVSAAKQKKYQQKGSLAHRSVAAELTRNAENQYTENVDLGYTEYGRQ